MPEELLRMIKNPSDIDTKQQTHLHILYAAYRPLLEWLATQRAACTAEFTLPWPSLAKLPITDLANLVKLIVAIYL